MGYTPPDNTKILEEILRELKAMRKEMADLKGLVFKERNPVAAEMETYNTIDRKTKELERAKSKEPKLSAKTKGEISRV